MRIRYSRIFSLMAAALAANLTASAHATTINAITDGRWYQFDVDESLSNNTHWIDAISDSDGLYRADYSNLNFSFTLTHTATLTIVDGGLNGDAFQISVNGQMYSTSITSAAGANYVGTDFDSALADNSHFSALSLQLAPGNYTVTGALTTSVRDETNTPLNATVGGIRISEVPVPSSAVLFGTAMAAAIARTRYRL